METTAPKLWGDKNKPAPSGIRQGGVGDCWFLAAASSVAEQPERIKRVMWNDNYDQHGAFRFYFWVRDTWHGINIDDRLPASGSSPMFAKKSQHNAWWFALMEKAYAKLDRHYFALHGGMPFEALRNLTNMPTLWWSMYNKSADAVWDVAGALAARNHPMTAPCCNSQSGL